MHTFYSSDLVSGGNRLSQEESHHCAKVLRLTGGEEIRLIDGNGIVAKATITNPNAKSTEFRIMGSESFERSERECTIAIAPTKSIDRFEFFLEKAVELGVDRIIPILCKRSERKNLKHERMEKIVMAATKQSLRPFLPEILPLTKFEKLENVASKGTMFIAHCEEGDKTEVGEIEDEKVILLIGPEGDFSSEEIELANNWGAKPLSLGTNRLRTETAGIFAASMICKNEG